MGSDCELGPRNLEECAPVSDIATVNLKDGAELLNWRLQVSTGYHASLFFLLFSSSMPEAKMSDLELNDLNASPSCPFQAPGSLVCVFTFQPANPSPTFTALDGAPISTVITELTLRGATCGRRSRV